MIRPAPATQPWPESTNWTAASAADGVESNPDEGDAVAEAPRPAQDEADAGGTALAGPLAELAELGVELGPADAVPVRAGVLDGAAADPDDAAAQPAIGAATATASTASAEAAARRGRGANVWFARALKGISFVTFQMTLYRLARLYRIPSVRSWG
ncbi:MAG TPA: hypothetical protein VII59_16700 [Streptosporangiaceae bacterium]